MTPSSNGSPPPPFLRHLFLCSIPTKYPQTLIQIKKLIFSLFGTNLSYFVTNNHPFHFCRPILFSYVVSPSFTIKACVFIIPKRFFKIYFVRLSVSQSVTLRGNVIFFTAFKDRKLRLNMRIYSIYCFIHRSVGPCLLL